MMVTDGFHHVCRSMLIYVTEETLSLHGQIQLLSPYCLHVGGPKAAGYVRSSQMKWQSRVVVGKWGRSRAYGGCFMLL